MLSGKYGINIAPQETAREGPQASPSVPPGKYIFVLFVFEVENIARNNS